MYYVIQKPLTAFDFMTEITKSKSMFLYHQIHNNVFESSKQGKFQSVYTHLKIFLLLTYSCLPVCKPLGVIRYSS